MWVGCAAPGTHWGGISESSVPTVSVEVLRACIDSDPTTFVLDVRTPEEYDGPLGHIENARLIPLQELGERLDELNDVKDRHIYIICKGGVRSATATGMLLNAGFKASNVAGGMRAWQAMNEQEHEMKGSVPNANL
ncbi:MAG: rhodanese-like domain-containing protein [Fidelibacterota bacterium]|nr:MAG: rhodanese-like domain-containing protein [Candidatus Neomarinimicrobiota bacterium]